MRLTDSNLYEYATGVAAFQISLLSVIVAFFRLEGIPCRARINMQCRLNINVNLSIFRPS